MAQKKQRDSDPEYLAAIRQLPCLCCGKDPPSEVHHIKTRGSGGGDEAFNCLPLCPLHHTRGTKAWHKIGPSAFLKLYPHVWKFLKSLGWEMDTGKLRHPRYADKIGE